MGVKNLWRLLLPAGHRLSIETLSGQTLAIDASIWLAQISKACRDPETGRPLPNRPHVRVFLLRLMRLLYHRIRPVVVFDGAMPEAKRLELARRRRRRERLWRGGGEDEGDDGTGGGALRRAAKKILVRRLREWREKEAKAAAAESGEVDAVAGERAPGGRKSSRGGRGGAFAEGFNLAEEDDGDERATTDGSEKKPAATKKKAAKDDDDGDDGVISVHSKDSREAAREGFQSQLEGFQREGEGGENDWETSAAVQATISESIRQQQELHGGVHASVHVAPSPDRLRTADDGEIAGLAREARNAWIEDAQRRRRIASRRECIGAAADPSGYSAAQLRNFLEGSRLNARVGRIGKLAEKMREEGAGEGYKASDDTGGERPLKRLRRSRGPDGEEDEDAGVFDGAGDRRAASGPSMRSLFGEDDSDDDVASGGGGFLLAPRGQDRATGKTAGPSCAIEIDSDGSDDVGFADRRRRPAATPSKNGGADPEPKRETFDRARFMELSNADEEWAAWGADADGGHVAASGQAAAGNAVADGSGDLRRGAVLEVGSSEEDSDGDDGGVGRSFLMLGGGGSAGTLSRLDAPAPPKLSVGDAASEAPEPPFDVGEEEDEDDSVDWEDGDTAADGAGPPANGNGITVALSDQARATDRADPAGEEKATKRGDAIEVDSSDGEEPCSQTAAAARVGEKPTAPGVDGPEEEARSAPRTEAASAALERAQGTASRLAGWAGRAFRRAIAEHDGGGKEEEDGESEGGGSVGRRRGEDINLTTDGDVEEEAEVIELDDAEEEKAAGAKSPNEEDGPDGEGGGETAPTRAPPPPPALLDTSIGGLERAERDILDEEREMERDMGTITDEMKDDILRLLRLCGIPWVESPSEAEAQCAALERLGLVDGVVTEDSDIFVFGGQKVYKNFFDEQKFVEAYYSRDIERELGLDKDRLVALAMLLGGDYTDGVRGVGIVNGMEVLRAFPPAADGVEGVHGGLSRFRDWMDGIGDVLPDDATPPEVAFHGKHRSARARWAAPADFPSRGIITAYLRPAVDTSRTRFTWARPDLDALQRFCADTLGWEREETARVVGPVLKVLESTSTQTRLESYFMRYEDNVTFGKVKSKRLQDVLKDIKGNTEDVPKGESAD